MLTLRPYRIFTLFDPPPMERIAKVPIPSRRGAGGISLLETLLMITAAHIVEAKRVFEIGTFLGGTTLSLALNIPEDGEIFTLDLDESHAREVNQDPADAPLTSIHLDSRLSLDFSGSPVAKKISDVSR